MSDSALIRSCGSVTGVSPEQLGQAGRLLTSGTSGDLFDQVRVEPVKSNRGVVNTLSPTFLVSRSQDSNAARGLKTNEDAIWRR